MSNPERPTNQSTRPGGSAGGGRPGGETPSRREPPRGGEPARPSGDEAARAESVVVADGGPATRVEFQDHRLFHELLGHHDEHVKIVERALGVRVGVSGKAVTISGDEVQRELAAKVLTQLYGVLERGFPVFASDVDYAIRIVSSDHNANVRDIFLDTIYIAAHKRVITPKSITQKTYIDAIRNHDIVFAIGPAGTGKCVAGSTLVLTDRGLVPIAELAAGTEPGEYRPIDVTISGRDGAERASHVYNGGRSRTRRIRTRFGYEIEATPEHPLLHLRVDGEPEWTRADALQEGDFVALQRGQQIFGDETRIGFTYQRNGRHDHARAIDVAELDEELGYMLGVLTGDGCVTFRNRVILTSADDEIVAAFARFAARLGLHVFPNGDRPYDHVIASAQLYQLLLHLGMSAGGAAEKRVPHAVLRAPREIVRAFVRGLFDTDGTVERRGGYPSFCSASARLVDEVQLVLLDFGIVASKRTRDVRYDGGRRRYYELEIGGAEAATFFDEIGFGLARTQALRQSTVANTNVDVIPHVAGLLDLAVRAMTLSRAHHRRVYDYRIGRRRPSHAKLGEFLTLLAGCAATDAYGRLSALNDRRIFWTQIVAIEDGEADVYDLTVPSTHSFCAGGFVNHNTYLAMAMGVAEVMKQGFHRIILTRPAVEAGEKLGFLPGDLAEKVNPYLRPLYDALHDMVDFDRARKMLDRGTIEVAPLAFMRGRAQPYFSRVLTPRGWRPIGSVRPGDAVIGSDGKPTTVLGVYPQGVKDVFRVTAQDGASTLCCGEHLWAVQTPADRRRRTPPRVLETREMIGRLRCAHQHRFELPLLSRPAELQAQAVPMDPYALGLLLGDGCLTDKTTPTFTTADAELRLALEHELDDISLVAKSAIDYTLRHVAGGRGGRRIPNPVTVTLRDLGLCGARSDTKFVPHAYLCNSWGARLALLQGLLDTDGGPVLQRDRTCRIQYTTTSPQLRDDVVFLVRSLGGVAYSRTRAAAGRTPGRARGRAVEHRHDAFIVDIRLPPGMMPFRLPRKWERYVESGGGGRPMRYIDAIEPVGRQDTVCIRVAAEDALYVTDDFLLTHNTLNDSFVILDEAQNTTPEQMKMFLTRLGFGSKAVITGDVTQTDLPAGKTSGLKDAQQILRNVPDIKFVHFTERDVVRHRLVQQIIAAYDRADSDSGRSSS